MRRTPILCGLVLCAFVIPVDKAAAQGIDLGVDGAFVLPLGDWSDLSGVGLGALARIEADVGVVAVTGRIGYISHFAKETGGLSTCTSELPILAGIKYGLPAGLYLALELGLVNFSASAEVESGALSGLQVDDSEIKFGGTLGGGVELGPVDVRIALFFPSLGDIDELLGLMFTVGYDIVSF